MYVHFCPQKAETRGLGGYTGLQRGYLMAQTPKITNKKKGGKHKPFSTSNNGSKRSFLLNLLFE